MTTRTEARMSTRVNPRWNPQPLPLTGFRQVQTGPPTSISSRPGQRGLDSGGRRYIGTHVARRCRRAKAIGEISD